MLILHVVYKMLSILGIPRLVFRLLFDRRVPFKTKLLPIFGLVYVLMPYDLIRGVPVIGWLDDFIVIIPSILAFLLLSPRDVVSEQLRGRIYDKNREGTDTRSTETRSKVIEGEYEFIDEDKDVKK